MQKFLIVVTNIVDVLVDVEEEEKHMFTYSVDNDCNGSYVVDGHSGGGGVQIEFKIEGCLRAQLNARYW